MDNHNGTASGGPIREARLALHLSQEELARRADCSTVYVRLLESGYAPSQSDVIPRILRVLNEKRPGGNQVALKTASARDGRHAPE
jgi:predicted transcriptional regulator